MALARSDEVLLVNALEESLRYEPPVMFTARTVKEPITMNGLELKPGQLLLLSIAGANRDPAVNEDPETFDIRRDKVVHVSFGYGIHLCLGMSLARLEAKDCVSTSVRTLRQPGIRRGGAELGCESHVPGPGNPDRQSAAAGCSAQRRPGKAPCRARLKGRGQRESAAGHCRRSCQFPVAALADRGRQSGRRCRCVFLTHRYR